MKKFRKLTAVITALCLAGSMIATMSMLNVSAEGESTTYSITITNDGDKATHTYEAYQIFAGSLSGTGTDTDPYILSNITWGNGIDTTTTVDNNTLLNAIKEISVDNGNTTPFSSVTDASSVANVLSNYGNDSAMAQEFASVVGKYLSSTKTGTYSNGKITGLSAGYYLVQDASNPTGSDTNSGAKTRYILKVAGDVTVETKNSAPSVMKKVYENQTTKQPSTTTVKFAGNDDYNVGTGYNDVADYNIGDTVPFKLYGSLPSTYNDYDTYYYEFQDTLGKEFTVDKNSIKVYVNGTEVNRKDGDTLNWNAIVTENLGSDSLPSDATKINVYFADTKTIASSSTDIITVEYNAVLNTNAEIGLPGQENEVKLVYSNNPNNSGSGTWNDNNTTDDTDDTPDKPKDSSDNEETGGTPEDKVIVFTYELDITKVDGATLTNDGKTNENTKYLKDAEFLLYKDNGAKGELVTVYSVTDGSSTTLYAGAVDGGTATNIAEVKNEEGTVTTQASHLKTNDEGKIVIKGLDDGTYYLEEVKAPAGYNELDGYIKLEITANTQNNQSWTGTPSEALKPEASATGTDGGVKLTITPEGSTSSTIDYSLVTKDSDNNVITDNGIVEALIENNKGSSLPSTGGIGTTIFYMVGGVLVVGAGVTLIAKKRMKNNEQ